MPLKLRPRVGPTGYGEVDAIGAHTHSSAHRADIEASGMCGCFYCCELFKPTMIDDWTDEEQTALCPNCGIDSVIGDKSGYPIEKYFMRLMHRRWFDR